MKLYKMLKTTRGEGFLESDKTYSWYCLAPGEDVPLIESKDQVKKYNKLYAIAVDTEKMEVGLLLEALMGMPVEEVKRVLDSDPWIKAVFLQYVANPIKEIEEETKTTSQNASAAAGLAGMGFVNSLF